MTIPTREEALRAINKLTGGRNGPLDSPLAETVRSYIEGHTGEPLTHEWHERFGLTCCKVCGLVRNENSDTKGCRGPVYVSLRDASPVQPDTAPTEALTRIDALESERNAGGFAGINSVMNEKLRDANETICEQRARIEELVCHALLRPIGWQDVRLAVGEGKLTNNDVLDGVNAELRRRATLTQGIKE